MHFSTRGWRFPSRNTETLQRGYHLYLKMHAAITQFISRPTIVSNAPCLVKVVCRHSFVDGIFRKRLYLALAIEQHKLDWAASLKMESQYLDGNMAAAIATSAGHTSVL